jgi:hypothetical protein
MGVLSVVMPILLHVILGERGEETHLIERDVRDEGKQRKRYYKGEVRSRGMLQRPHREFGCGRFAGHCIERLPII